MLTDAGGRVEVLVAVVAVAEEGAGLVDAVGVGPAGRREVPGALVHVLQAVRARPAGGTRHAADDDVARVAATHAAAPRAPRPTPTRCDAT